jgi:hypothetical protein
MAASGVQVFELTMDNPEDQDELNRWLRKPGEPRRPPLPKDGHSGIDAPTTQPDQRQEG